MYIGNDNVFEVGSVCHALTVGDNNVFEIKSKSPLVLQYHTCELHYQQYGTDVDDNCMSGVGIVKLHIYNQVSEKTRRNKFGISIRNEKIK
jgi:hypothetical protein